jgi:tetratricopeptide (TPR) repeat protein
LKKILEHIVTLLVSIVSLVLFILWYLRDGEYEPLIGITTSLGFIVISLLFRFSKKDNSGNNDQEPRTPHDDDRQPSIPKELKKLTNEIPILSQDKIVGRGKDLNELHKLLKKNKEALLLNGLGGIGKTTLAQVYVQKYWKEYHHIAWVTQKQESDFLKDFISSAGLMKNLGIKGQIGNPSDTYNEIIRRLNEVENHPNLLILDNVDESIEKFTGSLPDPDKWHILLTSREELNGFTHKRLDFLSPEDAFKLFKKYYTIKVLTDDIIKKLLKKIDYHTLTIEILARTANCNRYDYVTLSNALKINVCADIKIQRPYSDEIKRVTSFLCDIFSISKLNDDEIWLLQQMACLPSEYLPYDDIEKFINPKESNRAEIFAVTLNKLTQKGWLLRNETTDSYKMHVVITEVVLNKKAPRLADINVLLENITTLLIIDQTKDNPIDKFPLIPFGQALLLVIEMQPELSQDEENSVSRFHNNLATVLKNLGDYDGAKDLLEKAVMSNEKNFGTEHPATSTSYSNLATVLQDLGEYEGAKDLLEKAARSNEINFGTEHPATSTSYSNLATVLQDLGEYEGAKDLLEKAARSNEINFGTEHPATSTSYSNLATVLQDLGEYEGAKDLLEKAVRSAEKNFGTEHPATATRYSNLALVLKDLGEYNAAKDLLEKVVRSDEENFGTEHPTTAVSYSNLALVLKDLGDYESAKDLLEKAVRSAEKNFGTEHPTTAAYYSNLALVLKYHGDYESAKDLFEKALMSAEKNFGTEHPATATCYSNLATVLDDLGDYDGAMEYSSNALIIIERVLPPGHPNIDVVRRIHNGIKSQMAD